MKRLLLAFTAVTFLLSAASCNNTGKQEASTEEAVHSHEAEEPARAEELSLNNGQKWQTDQATGENVTFMKTMADNFGAEPNPGTTQYQLLGNDMQKGLDKLIQQCTMKGAAHDELHKWLEPVIRNIKDLKGVTDSVRGQQLFTELKGRFENYGNFFQYDN